LRVLLDECVPARLAGALTGHAVSTVQRERWGSRSDGWLISNAGSRFDVIVTVDRRFVSAATAIQAGVPAVVLLRPKLAFLPYLLPLVPRLLIALETARPGEVIVIEPE
jgi:predicted nuclease of predicted toxin-antitoxin system